MVNATAIQNKITNVLNRTDLKTDITLITLTAQTNDWGLEEYIDNTSSQISGIVLDYESTKKKHDESGKFNNSSFILLLDASTLLTEGDLLEFKSKRYMVDSM